MIAYHRCDHVQSSLLQCLTYTNAQIFFTDTLKFFISLYGHKLPVLTIDISSDNTLIITGYAVYRVVSVLCKHFINCSSQIYARNAEFEGTFHNCSQEIAQITINWTVKFLLKSFYKCHSMRFIDIYLHVHLQISWQERKDLGSGLRRLPQIVLCA